MRIGINGRFLIAKQTGVQRVAYNLIKTLVRIDSDNEYFLFTNGDEAAKKEWQYKNCHVIACDIYPGKKLKNLLWEQFTLPRLAKKYKVDLLHSPANMAPLFYSGKSIITIYDVCFVVNPQWYSFLFRTWYTWIIPKLARKAAKVITDSNNSRNDILKFCKVEISKICLVYWAVDESFLDNYKQKKLDPKTEKSEDYILFVGSVEPRKNINTLLSAYERMRTSHPEITTKLMIVGGENPIFANQPLAVDRYKDDIIIKGFVGEKQLRAYYRGAKLVAYPSLYEGFGLPPLEAMASGTPVVTSNTSSLPEVVADAAITLHPYDVAGLADWLYRLITDEALQNELVTKGLKQVRRFSWYRVARGVLNVYYQACQPDGHKADHQKTYIPFDKWKQLVALENESLALLDES